MKKIFLTVTPKYDIEEGSLFESIELANKAIVQEAKDSVRNFGESRTIEKERAEYINGSSVMGVEVTEEEWEEFKKIEEEEGNRFDVLQTVAPNAKPTQL